MDTILPILKKIPIFVDLSEEEHKEIVKNIGLNYYPVGYVFFKEGDSSENGSMYILKKGMVKITRSQGHYYADKEVAVLSDNDFFGEMALVTNDPRNATVTSISECEVFELKKDDFIKLVETSPLLANKISTEFVERAKKNK